MDCPGFPGGPKTPEERRGITAGRYCPLLCILLTLLPWGAPKAIDVGAHAGLFWPLNEDTGIPEYGGAHGLSLGLDLEKRLPRIGAVVAGASWIPLEVDATDFFPQNRGYEGWGACGRVGVVPGPDAKARFIGGAFLHRRHIEWEDADPEEEGFVQSTETQVLSGVWLGMDGDIGAQWAGGGWRWQAFIDFVPDGDWDEIWLNARLQLLWRDLL